MVECELAMSDIDPTETIQDSGGEDRRRKIAGEPMADAMFSSFRTFIHTELGIHLPDAKKSMLQSRLQKRLRKLGLNTFEEYHAYVFSPEGLTNELSHLIDVVTTRKTDFFREPTHFEYLTHEAVPRLLKRKGRHRPLKMWSAGCSTGEEPYTLAIVLRELTERLPEVHFFILATDISEQALEQATLGIYALKRIEPVPKVLRNKYFLKSKEQPQALVRIVPELRSLVTFRRLNLMAQDFGMREAMDVIFCRNVLIYFDKATQEIVLDRLCRYLKPGGYLFIGHSETLHGFDLPLHPVARAVYKKIVKTYADAELPLIHLNPGELLVSEKPAIVRTVLGSCIAVTMFNHRLKIAAICHALLPQCQETKMEAEREAERWKYVDAVIPDMIQKMRKYGIEPKEIEVKIFGGADVLSSTGGGNNNPTVGSANIAMAQHLIEAERLRLKVSDVGGTRGRKIFFYTYTGEVLVKRLDQSEQIP